MIEDVRELLQRIDRIVEAEYLRLNDEIDALQTKLKKITDSKENITALEEKTQTITTELHKLKQEKEEFIDKLKELPQLRKKSIKLEQTVEELKQQQEGLKFTVKVISSWIPSQKENIDVLVVLSSSPNHEATYNELHTKTTIPLVTLKNRVIPLLAEKYLVEENGNKVRLTFKLPEIDEKEAD